jgi:uncharacterized protein with HEPN domain
MQRDLVYVRDIVTAARKGLSYIDDYDLVRFLQNDEKQDACIRVLEIICEASRRVSPQTKQEFYQLPWTEMVGMRNMLIHEYSQVDPGVVWKTISEDLPELLDLISSIFPDLP